MAEKYIFSSFLKVCFNFLVSFLVVASAVGQPMTVSTLHYTTREGLGSNVVNTIMQDHQGYLWIGTNLGLTRFDGYRFENFYREENGQRRIENITGIVEDTVQNRLIVCGTDYYLYPFDLERMQLLDADTTLGAIYYKLKANLSYEPAIVHHAWDRGVQYKNKTRRHDALHYVSLPNGNEVWTTIDNGFYIYNEYRDRLHHFSSASSQPIIESDLMSHVLVDRSGGVWMSNYAAGLYQLRFAEEGIHYHQFTNDSASDDANSVRSFSELPDGRVLISNMNGDVYCYDLETCRSELLTHKEHRVYATLTDKQGRLWMAMRNGGVYVDERHLNTEDGLEANIIFHLFGNSDDTVWISTLDGGLIAASEQNDGHFTFKSFLEEEKVHQVDADAQGRLWVATESGVFVLENETFHRVHEGSKVVGICCTDDNRVLAATIGNGMLVIDDNTQTFVTTADGLANDCVKAVVWDACIGTVASTDAGFTVIAPNGEMRSFNSPEGMMADTYNESAALRLTSGHILLGSLDGFVEIEDSTAVTLVGSSLSPTITSIAVNGTLRLQQQFTTLTLPHDRNNIRLTFSCLDYKRQSSIIYSYRLDGLDDNWQLSTKESTTLYNNLSPGHYRFRLRAACAGRPWSEESVLEVHIRQPWWWTWWARITYLVIVLLFLWHEWRHYCERQRLRRQLEQRLTALYVASTSCDKGTTTDIPADATAPCKDKDAIKDTTAELKTGTDAKVADREFLDKLDRIILSHLLQKDLDIAFLADKMCMSHSTLYRRIKMLTGMTASEYVRKHRLAKAMQLLRDGHTPTEVALQCGFGSPSYFTRCFKSEYGILPSEV